MRYDEFREAFSRALHEAGLHPHMGHPTETLDLATTRKRWEAIVGSHFRQRAEPFHVIASICFSWDALDAARTDTTEEAMPPEPSFGFAFPLRFDFSRG